MPLNPLSVPFVPGGPSPISPAPSQPPSAFPPTRGPLDYDGSELAQGDEIWGLSRLADPSPPPTPPEPGPAEHAQPRETSQDDDQTADQAFVTANESTGTDDGRLSSRLATSEGANRAQQEVSTPSLPPPPPPPSHDVDTTSPDDQDDDETFQYPSDASPPPEEDAKRSTSDPLLSAPSGARQPPPASPAAIVQPTPATSPAPPFQPESPPPDPTLIPSIVSAIGGGELYKLERIYAASSLSPFALSNTPLSQHTLVTPLHLAASHGHLSIVQFLCSSEGGALVGMEDAEGETALHKASLKGHLPVVAFLIKNQGVSPHARDKEGFTALHNACSKGFLDIVRFLCSNSSAASYDPEESISDGQGRVKGVDRRSKGTGWTPLMCACADGHLPTVLYLLSKHNADPLVRNNFGETAYDVSAGVFEVYICEVLESFEASRWPSGDAPRAEPFNVLAVHTSVPVLVYENQRLDARLKTLATSSGKPRFSPSGLGKLGRRSPWELKVPAGSRIHAPHAADEEGGKWAGVIPTRRKEAVDLPERRRAFVMPLPTEAPAAGAPEKSHFWLSDWAVDVSSPKVDAQTGWQYAPSFSTPYDQWSPTPPPPLSHLLTGASLVSAALGSSPRSGSDHHLSATPATRAEQGSATWVRRRAWVRIMRRRLDLDALPFLEPDGMSLAGFEADGARVGGRGTKGGDGHEGEEMGSFQPSSWVSGTSTVDGRAGGLGGSDEGDYIARARYLSGGRKGLKAGKGADAVSIRTVRGREDGSSSALEEETEADMTLADLRRRLGKLERAIGGLRHGLTTETDDFRKNAAGSLLVELSNELEHVRTTISSRGGYSPQDGSPSSPTASSDSSDSEFVYPATTSPTTLSSTSRRRTHRGSSTSRTTSASTDYFHVSGSQAPDITTVLSESDAFRVPTHEAGLKVRRQTGSQLSPMIARPEWQPDTLATHCSRCVRRFTFFLRKHHCRRCGLVVCDACSSHRTLLPPAEIVLDPQTPFGRLQEEIEVEHRTCDTCFVEVTTPELGRRGSEGGQGSGSGTAASVAGSELADCPVCNRSLADFGTLAAQEAHVKACLEDGGSAGTSLQAGRYLVYKLSPESALVGVECVICLEEFIEGVRVARLNCLCSFHDGCLSAWLSRGRSCPVHARET